MYPRTLVAGPNWVGDLVMAGALFKVLKTNAPARPIDLLAPAGLLPLAERIAEVDQTIELPGGHGELALRARWRLARSLRRRSYVEAYVLPRSAKAALVPWLARVPRRVGYRGEMRYGLLNDIREPNPAHETVIQRYAALAFDRSAQLPASLPRPTLLSPVAARLALVERFGLRDDVSPVALCPGAEYGPAKRWPAASYGALATHLLNRGRSVWVLGSARESSLGAKIAEHAPGARNLAGKTTLAEAVDLLATASVVVTNDSGLMHVAAAAETPVIAIYGSSSPRYTPPASPAARMIYHALPCSPCFSRECPLGHLNCLRGIEVSEVITALTSLNAS